MRKLLIAATVAVMLLGSAFAIAADTTQSPQADGKGMMERHHGRMMEKMDADKDGANTRSEHDAFTAERFKEMDGDGDGRVTQEEMQKHHQEKMAKWAGKRHGGGCHGKDEAPAPAKE